MSSQIMETFQTADKGEFHQKMKMTLMDDICIATVESTVTVSLSSKQDASRMYGTRTVLCSMVEVCRYKDLYIVWTF